MGAKNSRCDSSMPLAKLCVRCGKSYKYRSSLDRHLKYECGVKPKFKCPFCDHVSKQKSNFPLAFSSAENIDTKIGNGKSPLFRYHEVRSKRSGRNTQSMVQSANSSQHPFVCNRCNRSYKYQTGLASHQRFECGVQPQFNCTHCSFTCKLKGNLKKHIALRHLQMIDFSMINTAETKDP
ncbi:hypothetical protein LSTR_LSTR000954 [Laodelphax striatellus]|uniref:C2H2-type domain-containing protein n=1 Tax=Laodelphax striatellus TaxID=195883 RepID=A0A482X130_LAOST|nr:hypothetical protein LSTR_LSTR000954 [Laodelphax striatellus]